MRLARHCLAACLMLLALLAPHGLGAQPASGALVASPGGFGEAPEPLTLGPPPGAVDDTPAPPPRVPQPAPSAPMAAPSPGPSAGPSPGPSAGPARAAAQPASSAAPMPARPAAAQAAASAAPARRSELPRPSEAPVTFTADEVDYDQERGIVTARGRVEAWQEGRLLRADTFIYDRTTGVAIARGNVQLIEADGQVMFADSVELKNNLRDGVLEGVRALLAANGKLAANGVRRTNGMVNEFGRVVYSACDLCAEDPTRPPLWQVEAKRATQDKDALRISYRDATVRMFGLPIFWTPYFSHPDPSTPRASGFMFPTFGVTKLLGGFSETPYYWAIDEQSDALITPIFSTKVAPNLGGEYRRMFNSGSVTSSASVGYFSANAQNTGPGGPEKLSGHFFLKGRFSIDDNWRVGFDANVASNELYLRTYRYVYARTLNSRLFAEGFWGTEEYAVIDSRAYQGLRATDVQSQIPFVAPYLFYEKAPAQKVLGGWLSMDVGQYSIYRTEGTQTQRLATRMRWERPEIDDLGGIWTLKMQGDALGYYANGAKPVGNMRLAGDWRMPFVRSAGDWGTQTIEPHVQVVTGPQVISQIKVPNEDSVVFEFSDANLFNLSRYVGRDRLEGGSRTDYAVRAVWDFPNGGAVDGLIGQSYRLDNQIQSPYPGSGLQNRLSDYVARMRVAPVSWFDVVGRIRTDSAQPLQRTLADTVGTVSLGGGNSIFGGYLWTPPMPYLTPYQKRDEVAAGGTLKLGDHWSATVASKYSIINERPAVIWANLLYDDECFAIEGRFFKRFAENSAGVQYAGNTFFLVRINFKTLGQYYFRAI
jgi:LPS-assembly protein